MQAVLSPVRAIGQRHREVQAFSGTQRDAALAARLDTGFSIQHAAGRDQAGQRSRREGSATEPEDEDAIAASKELDSAFEK